MKLSYTWLKDYLDFDMTPQEVAKAMTSIGIEVDSVSEQEEIPGGLAGVVVAKVVECEAHPDSDHLHITKVDAGMGELLTVVCGAPNVAAGQKVLFASIGSVLPGDFKIKKSKIRGVESFGMICAEDELGIGNAHNGIMVLPEDAIVGTSAKDFLHLKTEAVIEYEITANRVDAASHFGVARDLYAYLKLNNKPCHLQLPEIKSIKISDGSPVKVSVDDVIGVPRYNGITIRGVQVKHSPEWLQKKLLSIGLKPVNSIVDISNFVLFELGQPLHIFDADKISGNSISVRRALVGESLVTLDGIERKLDVNDIVIADDKGAICLAGILGGKESGVTENTKNIFIEGAYFDSVSIRKTSKRLGIQTDASFRYERGADPEMAEFALKRAAALVLELAGGAVSGKIQEFYPNKIEKKVIELNYDRIEKFIGKSIGREVIENILTDLHYEFIHKNGANVVVAAPSYMIDVTRECDVVEEILRIYGYDNIDLPNRMSMSVNPTPFPDPESVRNDISDFFAANGFCEMMNNSLTKRDYYEGLSTFPSEKCVQIVNPLSSDLNVMRQSLIPGGLEVIEYNINTQSQNLKLFEYGSVYSRFIDKDPTKLEGYEEHSCFTLFVSGVSDKSWRVGDEKSSYFMLKGYVELLLKRYSADLCQMEIDVAPSDLYSEGIVYKLPGQNKTLLTLGTINPVFAKKFNVKQAVFVAEIDWNVLFELVKRDKVRFEEMPKFPGVKRDLAILLDESIRYVDLYKAAFKSGKKLLKQIVLFDVYRGDKIPDGKKQYAMSFIIQDIEKTLTDNDVERVMEKIMSSFTSQFGAVLR